MVEWIESDGRLRTHDEIIDELLPELGFQRRGARIEDVLRSVSTGIGVSLVPQRELFATTFFSWAVKGAATTAKASIGSENPHPVKAG